MVTADQLLFSKRDSMMSRDLRLHIKIGSKAACQYLVNVNRKTCGAEVTEPAQQLMFLLEK